MRDTRRLWWVAVLVLLLVAASVTTVAAQTAPDKVVMGGNYELATGQTLNSGLVVLGGNAVLQPDSTVNGNVAIMGGTLRAAGHIRGDASVMGGTVSLEGTAVVDGNLNTIGGTVNRAPGATIRGSTQENFLGPLFPNPPAQPERPPRLQVEPPQPLRSTPFGFFLQLVGRFFGALGLGLLMAIIGVVVVLVAPVPTGRVATAFAAQPAVNFAVGLLTLVLALLIGVPLLLACGLGLLVWLLALIGLLFGWIAAGLWLGQRILAALKTRTASSLGEAALGIFLITWVTWLSPRCIGWLFGLVVGSMGLGAVLLSRFGTHPAPGTRGPSAPPAPAGGLLAPDSDVLATQPAASGTGYSAAGEGSEPAAEAESQAPVRPGDLPGADVTRWEPEILPEAPAPRAASLEDLEAVAGITPEIARRLRASGNTTLVTLATSDPETLANAAGVDAEQVRQEDWIGQARRLLG